MTTSVPLAPASRNAQRWQNAKLTRNFAGFAQHLVDAKARYQKVAAATGVPWPVIAVIHMRESSQSWAGSLAQGDPWTHVSTHVPRGRGPFRSWEDAAIDALVNCPPKLARNKDWSLAGTLDALEKYNGVGYRAHGVPSPYLWAGTNQYRAGKYVADGRYDPNHVDEQPGTAGLLMAMMVLDSTIHFDGASLVPAQTPATVKLGAHGELVTLLQTKLGIYADGDFGALTESAVRKFQTYNHLTVDGIAGPQVWNALGVSI